MERAVLLSGEHPTLPSAELAALLSGHAPMAPLQVHGLVAVVDGSDAGIDEALSRMALAHAWGELWLQVPDDDEAPDLARSAVAAHWSGPGPMAVVTERRGSRSPRSRAVIDAMGAAASAAGARIDLTAPKDRLFAWFIDGTITIGRLLGEPDRSRFEIRTSEHRGHFAPVSMHPRRAASLLHLARVPPGGTIYDPFCGTGGFVLEAALEGYRVLGSDLDPWMVQGSYQTLTDVGPEPLDAELFVADVGQAPELVGPVDGIVTDLPYGRASGTDREPVRGLYTRALQAFVELLRPGSYAVIGCADPDLLELPASLVETERHAEYVHKSLTRHYVTVKRQEGVDAP